MDPISADRPHAPHGGRRAEQRRRRVLAAVAFAVVALLAAGCTSTWEPSPWDIELPAADTVAELRAATDCAALVDAARPALERTVASSWPDPDRSWWSGDDDTMAEASGDVAGPDPVGPASTIAPSPASGTSGATAPGAAADRAADAGGAAQAPVVVGTNNQEAAVDEADLVKTDGRRLVSVVNGVLRVVELDGSPTIDGTLDLSMRGATELFLRGDSALVLGATYGSGTTVGRPVPRGPVAMGAEDGVALPSPTVTLAPTTAPSTTTPPGTTPSTTIAPTTVVPGTVPPTTVAPSTTTPSTTTPPTTAPPDTVVPAPPPFPMATTLTLVSLADPAAPVVTDTADVEGSLVTARDQAGRARVVVQGAPVGMERLATAVDREGATAVVDDLSSEDLLPRVWTDGSVRPVGGCGDVLVAATTPVDPRVGGVDAPVGDVGTVTVLTVGDDLSDLRPVSVQGAAETVYASSDSLFIASASWDTAGSRTDLHRLDLTGDGPATYSGSGRAPGHLLNQFSLSERGGALRVVTTVDATSMTGGGDGVAVDVQPTPSARLTVLDTTGTLDEIGHLDGMGIGEQVQSVRFMDDIAYVVTFRQTDPLYALDLADPRAPRLLGELKIPGFSEYLHPVGEGLLLGVGRQVDPATGIDEGLKISLFDVSDPVAMTEVDQIVLPDASSEVSIDHHAFLWDPTRAQAVIPVEYVGCGATQQCAAGAGGEALVVGAGRSGLEQVGRFSHEPMAGWRLQPTRSVIVDDDLWTVSVAAIGRSDADTPTSVDLLRF